MGKSFWSSTRGKLKREMGHTVVVTPKMLATDGSEKDLVVVYKHFADSALQET